MNVSAKTSTGVERESAGVTTGSRWMKWVLLAAAGYNLLFGGFVVLAPNAIFDLIGAARPSYPEIWQCVGMIVGVYGVGYAIAAFDPVRHWPIVLVGLMGKVFGPIGFGWSLATGAFPAAFGIVIVFNDLIWLWPFAAILVYAWRVGQAARPEAKGRDMEPGGIGGDDGRGVRQGRAGGVERGVAPGATR